MNPGSEFQPGGDPPFPPHTAAAHGLASCHSCALVSPVELEDCPRCGVALHFRKFQSIQRTLALTVTGLILYFPANLLPIMRVQGIGSDQQNTILGGVVDFWHKGSYLVAAIIFSASVIIPILKFIALFWLCRAARSRRPNRQPEDHKMPNPRQATRIYRVIEIVGRWSMVDIFVVAVMVAIVQFGSLMTIYPGPAALSFAGVVILTMLAATCFDPRLLWDQVDPDTPVRALSLPLTLPRPSAPIDHPRADDR